MTHTPQPWYYQGAWRFENASGPVRIWAKGVDDNYERIFIEICRFDSGDVERDRANAILVLKAMEAFK